jgi:hypothetical protein
MATENTVRAAAIEELGTWLNATGQRRTNEPATHASRDGGTWRGPTEAVWMTRLLRGASPPRGSTGTGSPGLMAPG